MRVLGLFLLAFVAIGDEFDPYVQRFIEASNKYALPMSEPITIQSLKVEFGDTKPLAFYQQNAHGYCIKGEVPTVKIIPKSWEMADDTAREMILFHELGHCVLNRPHHAGEVQLGGRRLPASLMTAKMFSRKFYEMNRDYYLQELFIRP